MSSPPFGTHISFIFYTCTSQVVSTFQKDLKLLLNLYKVYFLLIIVCPFPVELSISVPSFRDQSYLQLSLPNTISLSITTNIVLTFNPTSSNGLLLYLGDVAINQDFLSLTLFNGYVQLRYNLGSGPVHIGSSVLINLNQWHTVEVIRTGKTSYIKVNGWSSSTVTSSGTATQLNPGGDTIFVGGIDESSIFSMDAGTELSFKGCIHSLKV